MNNLAGDEKWVLKLEINLPKNSFTHCGKPFDWDCVFQFWVYSPMSTNRHQINEQMIPFPRTLKIIQSRRSLLTRSLLIFY